MKKPSILAIVTAAFFSLSSLLIAADFKVDPTHSDVAFSIRHLFTNTKGQFKTFDGQFSFDESKHDLKNIVFTIKANSLDTNNAKRDAHLNGPDFFDSDKYPDITFKSVSVKFTGKNGYLITGPLTLHGVTKTVTFKAQHLGTGKLPWSDSAISSFTAETKINRKDFGMAWNKTLDKGSVLIGDEVAITVEIEAVQQK